MNILTLLRLSLIGLVALSLGHMAFASAAANSIPPTSLDSISRSVSVNDLAPEGCSGHDLKNLVSGDGVLTGTSGADLILGGSGDDTIDGMGGDDCILGGGGDDSLTGGDGDDTCIVGPGADVIDVSCEG
jgi:hypothetical protein